MFMNSGVARYLEVDLIRPLFTPQETAAALAAARLPRLKPNTCRSLLLWMSHFSGTEKTLFGGVFGEQLDKIHNRQHGGGGNRLRKRK